MMQDVTLFVAGVTVGIITTQLVAWNWRRDVAHRPGRRRRLVAMVIALTVPATLLAEPASADVLTRWLVLGLALIGVTVLRVGDPSCQSWRLKGRG
jgi:hypothetical protein